MLKIACTLATVFLFSSAFSQIDRGAFLIGTDFSFGKTEIDFPGGGTGEQKIFTISPSISTAVKQNLIVGADFTYSGLEYESGAGSGYMMEVKDMGAGLFVRQYKTIVPSLMVFLQGRVGYINIDREDGYSSSPQKTTVEGSNVNLSFMPGITYKAGKSVLIELGVKSLLTIAVENTTTTNPSFGSPSVTKEKSFDITSGAGVMPLSLGLRFIL